MSYLVRALKHPNYRLFLAGQAVSLLGLWVHWTAVSWLIFRMTDSAAMVGLVTLAMQGPALFLGPIGGALADRHDRRTLLILSQAGTVAPAAVLGVLTVTGVVTPAHIIALATLSGIARAVELPTRQAFVPELVGLDDLPNAIALNSALFNGARLIGPAMAGAAIPIVGEGWCFLANAGAYTVVLVTLLLIETERKARRTASTSILAEILEALHHVRHDALMLSLLGIVAIAAIAGMPYAVLLPSFAARQLGGGPETFSYLQAAVGLGAIVGAAVLATRRTVLGLERWVVWAAVGFGASLMALSRTTSTAAAVAVLAPIGFFFMFQMATTNTLLQTVAPDRLRGRVMSIHTSLFLGIFPIAGLLAGLLADRIGESRVMAAAGLVVVAGSLWVGRSLVRGELAVGRSSEAG